MSADFAYLDILDKKLDKSQRAACCRDLNTVVAAGAGSGKTQEKKRAQSRHPKILIKPTFRRLTLTAQL